MLPLNNRLSKGKDFEKVNRTGKSRFAENVGIRFVKNDLPHTRVGFVVGIKFSKKSVERNQMKRLLREILRSEVPKIKKGVDVIVIARKREREKIKKEKIKQDVINMLSDEKLIISKNN